MRALILMLSVLMLAACGQAPVRREQLVSANSPTREYSAMQDAALPTDLDFLLDVAAKDFHMHRPPDPATFRDVRFGTIAAADGKPQHLLCGEFLPTRTDGNGEWTAFATIRTSDYEQWIGGQSKTWCERDGMSWAKSDWSAELLKRLDALR